MTKIQNTIELRNNVIYIRDLDEFQKIYKTGKNLTKNLMNIINNSKAIIIKSFDIDLSNKIIKDLNLITIESTQYDKDEFFAITSIKSNNLLDIEEIKNFSITITNQFLYVIEVKNSMWKNLHKIGLTTKPISKRLTTLRNNSPLTYNLIELYEVFDCRILEKELHENLKQYRVNKEYFDVDISIIKESLNALFEKYKDKIITKKSFSDFDFDVANQTNPQIIKQLIEKFISDYIIETNINCEIDFDDFKLMFLSCMEFNFDDYISCIDYRIKFALKLLGYVVKQRTKLNKFFIQGFKFKESELSKFEEIKNYDIRVNALIAENENIEFSEEYNQYLNKYKEEIGNFIDHVNNFIEKDDTFKIEFDIFNYCINNYTNINFSKYSLAMCLRILGYKFLGKWVYSFSEYNFGFKIKKIKLIELQNKMIENKTTFNLVVDENFVRISN